MNKHIFHRKQWVPVVIQNSRTDAAPAALKSILKGFYLPSHDEYLREACQSHVDPTSLDAIYKLAVQLGLDAKQPLIPIDHLLLASAKTLPVIALVNTPNQQQHVIVIWRLQGNWAQIMDPMTGRHWIRLQALQQQLHQSSISISPEAWYKYASDESFIYNLKIRLSHICDQTEWINQCISIPFQDDNDWYSLATLDAGIRQTQSLIHSGALKTGIEAGELCNTFLQKPEMIADHYWSVNIIDDNQLAFKTLNIIQVSGLLEQTQDNSNRPQSTDSSTSDESDIQPEKYIFQYLAQDGLLVPSLVFMSLLLAAIGITLEVVVLRGLVEIGQQFHLFSQQLEFYSLMALFLLSLLIIEWPLSIAVMRLGRRLELRLRQDFLAKIPQLEERYFHSRLTSDMMQRAYELRQLRSLPPLAMNFFKIIAQIFFITIGLLIIYPQGVLFIILSSITIIVLSLMTQPLLQEQDLQFRTHTSSLSRFYLDALLGLMPIHSHSASAALSAEHENQLVNWTRSGQAFFTHYEVVSFLNLLVSTSLAIALVFSYLDSGGDSTGTLVLLFWMLQLPPLGRSLAEITQQYPSLRNRLIRLLEPLSVANESSRWYLKVPPKPANLFLKKADGAAIHFHQVSLDFSGHRVLEHLNLHISPSEHIAIVGKSGAGKSSLIGLLLGLYPPNQGGSVWVDGELLHLEHLQSVRGELAWVDPEVQLWNQSLADNMHYGHTEYNDDLIHIYQQADLLTLLADLPEGEDSLLGENARLLSGGEGQKVRLGRALNAQSVRLVILDEPFRGLTHDKRQALLYQVRLHWLNATLIFISHDIADSQGFDRVWVMDKGQVVEDAQPQALLAQTDSRYAQLLANEKAVHDIFWNSADWTRWKLHDGQLHTGSSE